jgi:hypothetical protein
MVFPLVRAAFRLFPLVSEVGATVPAQLAL